MLILPNEIHRTGNLGSFGYDRMLIHFSKELFEDILSLDVSMNPYQTLAEINNTQKVMFEILGYINNNYSEDLTLEAISEKFFLSTFYFSRTFREVTGFHFTEYVNNVRIKEAKKLLLNSSLSVNEISGSVGFHSSTHFGRVFRQIEGCSPSAYKKKELP